MAKGGRREGAGRKPGSVTVRPFREFVTDAEKKKFVEFILDTYMGDMRVAVWLGNQLFGQAPQSIDHTTMGKELPTPILGNVSSNNSSSEDTGA